MEIKTKQWVITEKEKQVLELIACGFDDDEIAERLGISKAYIRTSIVSGMLKKFGLTNRPALVAWGFTNSILN
ncbi:MAG: helix-turn-helix transcriptional regulator [Alphaproteobacteria bacterium]|nr:helix-turn-helix transcriptional regulator [Alphaproteobacteria bacterium]MBQ3946327.1 helix-turn-helix transcriptional regulator [Alphaproteobacteria bacterium]